MKATLVIVENDRDHQQAKVRVSAGRRRQSMNWEKVPSVWPARLHPSKPGR